MVQPAWETVWRLLAGAAWGCPVPQWPHSQDLPWRREKLRPRDVDGSISYQRQKAETVQTSTDGEQGERSAARPPPGVWLGREGEQRGGAERRHLLRVDEGHAPLVCVR